jgi:hypothetical protein
MRSTLQNAPNGSMDKPHPMVKNLVSGASYTHHGATIPAGSWGA